MAPFMDREKVTKSSSQIGFIKFALLPLFEALGQLFPVIEVSMAAKVIKLLADSLKVYSHVHEHNVKLHLEKENFVSVLCV